MEEWISRRICETKEEAENFYNTLYKKGIQLKDKEHYLKENLWIFKNQEIGYLFRNITKEGIEALYNKDSSYIFEPVKWSNYMKKEFTKQDLKNGDVCVLRNESILIAIPESGALLGKCSNWGGFNYYSNNLRHISTSMYDIVEVYRPNEVWQCDWEQSAFTKGTCLFDLNKEKPIEITIEEIAELKGVSADRIKIVKDKNE